MSRRADPHGLRRGRRGGDGLQAGGGPAPAHWARWTTDEKLRFLNSLPRKLADRRGSTRSTSASTSTSAGNNEVLFAWLDLAVANRYDPAVPALEHFLTVPGPAQVRPAADQGARRGRQLGPADRGARLCARRGRSTIR